MQLSFFSAAILAISAVNGISLNTSPAAQSLLDSNSNTETSSHALLDTWSTLLADGEGESVGENKAASWADADCEQRAKAATESGAVTPTVDAQASASVVCAFCVGRLQRFARSGFKRLPSESLEHSLALLLPA